MPPLALPRSVVTTISGTSATDVGGPDVFAAAIATPRPATTLQNRIATHLSFMEHQAITTRKRSEHQRDGRRAESQSEARYV